MAGETREGSFLLKEVTDDATMPGLSRNSAAMGELEDTT
jgi:hypothetical protein